MIISEEINHTKLQSIIVGELKKAGLKHTIKRSRKRYHEDHNTVFGAPLAKVPSCSVTCCESDLRVPLVVHELSAVLRENTHIEGLFRKGGSQVRQKGIKQLIETGKCISECHPIDIACVLKQYLRCLPEPLISAEVQEPLLSCTVTAGDDALKLLFHTLLLLPVSHVHLLHYIMELLNYVASKHKDNLMDSSNLAIVMAPSIMPLPEAAPTQRWGRSVDIVKIFIENSQHIGVLTEDLMAQINDAAEALQIKKRRSRSLGRMLGGLRRLVSATSVTSKRQKDSHEGLPPKTKKEIKETPQKESTPMKLDSTERERIRLSLLGARSTPNVNSDLKSRTKLKTSASSGDLLTSTEHLFSSDNIDLSLSISPIPKPDPTKPDNDYIRISKQEREDIRTLESEVENSLSREVTDVTPRVESLIRSQSARKSRSKENIPLIVIDKSEKSFNTTDSSQKYQPTKRISHNPGYDLYKKLNTNTARQSLSVQSKNSTNSTLNSTEKSQSSTNQTGLYQNVTDRYLSKRTTPSPDSQQKWRSAAAFFVDKTGEIEGNSQGSSEGRPSVNKLRQDNAGAVSAKAKLFESQNT